MRRVMLLIVSFLICGMPVQWSIAGAPQEKIDDVLKNIKWTGTAGFMISTGGKTICIDPYNLKTKKKADIVLITHAHGDHCSLGDLMTVTSKKTVFVIAKSCKNQVEIAVTPPKRIIKLMGPDERQEIGGVTIESTWAYNNSDHPKDLDGIGFIITVDGVRIYHAGGTGAIPEMKNYKADIVLVPLGGDYTVDNAVKIMEYTGASVVIPMHFDFYNATDELDALRKRIGSIARVVVLDY
jgi:L-ascorbate metabolism protein UlaG (beta-lactamase superfamily)